MIVVTGGTGLVGQALQGKLPGARYLSSKDVDLTDRAAVTCALADLEPSCVIHLAARVGGIGANMAEPLDFLVDNLRIDANVLDACRDVTPKHFVTLLSTCMYPDELPEQRYPLREDEVEAGPPPPTNASYAAAKRALMHGARALRAQAGVRYTAFIPSNLYGPGDHFDSDRSHFLAAAIGRLERARIAGDARAVFFGTGRAQRQYLFVDDLAHLIAQVVELGPLDTEVNVAPAQSATIAQLARAVAKAVGYAGDVVFSGEGPDGQLRKDASVERLHRLVPEWCARETSLEQGLAHTVEWFRNHVAAG